MANVLEEAWYFGILHRCPECKGKIVQRNIGWYCEKCGWGTKDES